MLLVCAALSFLLSGCLTSDTPLITAANSDRPLPAHFFIGHDSDPGKTAPVDLAGDNSYVFTDPDSTEKASLYFKKIADNLYAVSQPMIEKETGALKGYQYGYMQVAADGKIVIGWPECTEFDPDEVEKMGVEVEKQRRFTFCHVPSVEVLAAVLKSYFDDPRRAEVIKKREKEDTLYIITK
jgi:hypothetical protein